MEALSELPRLLHGAWLGGCSWGEPAEAQCSLGKRSGQCPAPVGHRRPAGAGASHPRRPSRLQSAVYRACLCTRGQQVQQGQRPQAPDLT